MLFDLLFYSYIALTIVMVIREAIFGDPTMNSLRAFARRQGLS